jgi:hypothetical protein
MVRRPATLIGGSAGPSKAEKMNPSQNNNTPNNTLAHDGAVVAIFALEDMGLLSSLGAEMSREIIKAAMEEVLRQQREEMLREGVN